MTEVMQPYFKQLDDIVRDLESQAYKIIEKLEQDILDLNKGQLKEKGVNSKGNKLKPYTPYTKFIKSSKGQPTDKTTLFDTGDFFNDFYLIAKNKEIEILSGDSKTPDLIAKYGKDLFGLTVKNNEEFNDQLKKRLVDWIIDRIII